MGYFDIFKDKSSQNSYKGVGKSAVKEQSRKRRQLRKVSGPGDPTRGKRPAKKGKRVYKRKKKRGFFDRLKRRK